MIEHLVARLGTNTKLTSLEIIYKHTLIPLYFPFVTEERKNSILKSMLDPNLVMGTPQHHIGLVLKKDSTPVLKYCSECVKEDIKKYGEAYWHRVHQIVGVKVCPHHRNNLVETKIVINDSKNRRKIHDINHIHMKMIEEYSYETEIQKMIATEAFWLLNNNTNFSLKDTKQNYQYFLDKKGFLTATGKFKLKMNISA